MEVIINAKQLKYQVRALQGVLAKKATIPILSNIKIVAGDDGGLTMTVTDLDVSLITSQEVDVLQSGSICLDGKKLGHIAGTLSDEPVHLKLNRKTEKVEVIAGRFNGKLVGANSDKFPEIHQVTSEPILIPAYTLYEGLRRTVFAVTEDEKRFSIGGILLAIENGELRIVSTDGHRLCLYKTVLSRADTPDLNCVIPVKAVRELLKILSGEVRFNKDSEVKVKKGSQIEFAIGRKILTAREVTESFPNWEKVVPNNFESFAEVNAKDFLEALIRVGVLANDRNCRIELVFYSDRVVLKAESSEVGFSREEVPCTFQYLDESVSELNSSNADLKIAFNAKYLMDFFSVHSTKDENLRVVWKFGFNGSQTELKFEGEEQMFSYILVPLKI